MTEVSRRCCASPGEVITKLVWEVISDLTFSEKSWAVKLESRGEQSGECAVRYHPADFITKGRSFVSLGFCWFFFPFYLFIFISEAVVYEYLGAVVCT